MIFKDML